MHYLSEEHILVFLIQIFVLLAAAKTAGSLCYRWGYPSLAGEILVGILLGPTLLGRALPQVYDALFPRDLVQQDMLETVSWFGVLFLLLATGFEIRLTSALKQGRAALSIGVIGVIVPFAISVAAFWWLPDSYCGENANHLAFTLFLATAASISAIAVIAKVLHDLDILKSDFGLVTLSGFVVNDILGWLVFALVLGLVAHAHAEISSTLRTFFEIILFGTVCLTVGSRMVGTITRALKHTSLPNPATTLAFISCMALLCGAITQWIGINAILGFFLAGIMVGNTPEITDRERETISQMVHAVFVPIFFAAIGTKIDFFSNLDILMVVVFTSVAIGGKFIGAWLGAVVARMPRADSLSVGIAFVPGGAMEIILGMLALEMKLITENVFVAIVFAALSSSIAVGPLLAWSMKRRRTIDICNYLHRDTIVAELAAQNRWEAISELCRAVAGRVSGIDAEALIATVRKREEIMGTGFEKGLAVPHGRIGEMKAPVIAFGKSVVGIDWDARDGLATHFVFLVLTPEKEEGAQVQILAAIAHCMVQSENQGKLMSSDNPDDILRLLRQQMHRPRP